MGLVRKGKEREVATYSTGELPGGDVEQHPDGAIDLELLLLGALHQIRGHCSTYARTNASDRRRTNPASSNQALTNT